MGGDYYGFIPTRPELIGRRRERGRWALVMGDVMGKGVPAGLLMTMLRGMLQAEVLSGLPPDRILHDLNQLAQEDLAQSHRFVTLFYSVSIQGRVACVMRTLLTITTSLAR